MRYAKKISVVLLLVVVALLASCATVNQARDLLSNRVSFTAPQLQAYLNRQSPREYKQLGGLVSLTVVNPLVSIPPTSNRLHLDFDVGISGLGMSSDKPAGHFAITSGLRYDGTAHALYLEDPSLESAELAVIGEHMNATGRDLINGWLRDYARTEPVYKLDASMLNTLGSRRVAGTLIEDGTVVIKLDRSSDR